MLPLVPLERSQPCPRHPARRAAPAATGAAAVLRRLRDARRVRARPVEERRHHRVRLHAQHRAGRAPAGSRRRSAACRPMRRCCRTGSARPSSGCSARGSTRRWPRACPFALLLVAGAGADLVQHLPPGPHRGGAAAAVRVRRRGEPGRLRAGDRRRRAARADRLARAAAARPRDDARAGAAGQRRAVRLRAGREPVPRALARARPCWSRCPRSRPAARRPSRWRSAWPAGWSAAPRATSRRGASCRGSRPAPCWPPAWRSRSAPGPGGSAAARGRSRARGSSLRLLALVHLAGLAAGAVDAVALARPPLPTATSRSRWSARCVSADRLPGDGRLGPRADARPAAAGRARRLRAADAAAQHRRGDRLVLGLLLQRRRAR